MTYARYGHRREMSVDDIIRTDVARISAQRGDWGHAKILYEAGLKSISAIAEEIGVPYKSIMDRSIDEGWVRAPQARATYEARTITAREAEAQDTEILIRDRAERVTAEMQARILITHRADIACARTLTLRLFTELESIMEDPDSPLKSRSDINLKLTNALKTQIQLERQAFGILGALEDPEQPTQAGASSLEIEKILDKFNLVLQTKTAPAPTAPILGEVVDVS